MKWLKIILALAVAMVLLMFVRIERPTVVRQLNDGSALFSQPELCPPVYWKDSRYDYYDFKEDIFSRRIPHGITDNIEVCCNGKVYSMKICSKYSWKGEFEVVKTYKTDHAGMVEKYRNDIEVIFSELLEETNDISEISSRVSKIMLERYPLLNFEIVNVKVK